MFPGQPALLTATPSPAVSGLFIHILGSDGSHFVCMSDACSQQAFTQPGGAIVDYHAILADNNPFPFNVNQLRVEATSNTLTVSWLAVLLNSSGRVLPPGTSTVLTALAPVMVNSGASDHFDLYIYDDDTGSVMTSCGFGFTCSIAISQTAPAVRHLRAAIADNNNGSQTSLPLPDVRATSDRLTVAWGTVSLSAGQTSVPLGSSVMMTATNSFDVSTTPDVVRLFDATTGTFGSTGSCTSTVCMFFVSQASPGTHTYVALAEPPGTSSTPPPAFSPISYHLISNTRNVTWS